MIQLTLPVPPSGNRAVRHVGRMTLASREARAYLREVARIGAGIRPLDGDVHVSIVWYRARRQGDVDNRAKVTLDALRKIAYHDDKQIARLTIARDDSDRANPRLEVTVSAA